MIRSRDQVRSALVYVQIASHTKAEWKSSYGGFAHKLPVLIRSAGLMQAVAFLDVKSKGDSESATGLSNFKGDLTKVMRALETMPQDKELAEHAQGLGLLDYMRFTRDTLEVLTWFKRFSESVLDVTQREAEESLEPEKEVGDDQPTPRGE